MIAATNDASSIDWGTNTKLVSSDFLKEISIFDEIIK
jgi:hypothetical protein